MSLNFRSCLLVGFFSLGLAYITLGQNHHARLNQLDILHYQFQLELFDNTDQIQGAAHLTLRFHQPTSTFALDLVSPQGAGKGMTVEKVLWGEKSLTFSQVDDQLHIEGDFDAQQSYTLQIHYAGIPTDGLIISKNMFGERTFFGDNWPNRAHHWLPTVDHPTDKATVEFIVTAPEHYQVIANGIQIEESNLSGNRKRSHWKTAIPLPTKVMVIGVARFAVQRAGEIHDIPVSSWVYPQNRAEGFYDYRPAISILDYFITHVGPYPYQKLANVQSKTRYGGMENAGNIFYFEGSVSGNREIESLLAHEIAHQWFGNSASEANWYHVWLSEGFATYFTHLYHEHTDGRDIFTQRMQTDRTQVLQYKPGTGLKPIVDTTVRDINQVLNTNSYQKGSWVLHMLRHKLGDEAFWKGIRSYYQQYAYGNALTNDLRAVMERESGQDLTTFFQQWLFTPGHPRIDVQWSYNQDQQQLELNLRQVQPGPVFEFPLEVAITGERGESIRKTFVLSTREQNVTVPFASTPEQIKLDPEIWLLFEGNVRKK